MAVGDYLYREGAATDDFYVVVSGAVDIVVRSDGEERLITRYGPGRFLGELNLLTGMRVFVSARVAEAGEGIAVPRAALHHVDRDQPSPGRHDPGRFPGPPVRAVDRCRLHRPG